MYIYIYLHYNLWCSVIITIITIYYSCPRLLVLLLSLYNHKPASLLIVIEFLLPLLFLSTISQLPLLLPLYYYYYYYYLLFTILIRYLPPYYHRQKKKKRERKKRNTLVHFWALWTFLAVLYSLQSSHVLFYNALPTAAAFYPLCDWQLSNGCWNDWYTFFAKRKKNTSCHKLGGILYVYVNWKWKKLPW